MHRLQSLTVILEAGYNYYGTEKLYSGIDGREMEADIFFGIVHYQRLRHMVSDKFQVRIPSLTDYVRLRTHDLFSRCEALGPLIT